MEQLHGLFLGELAWAYGIGSLLAVLLVGYFGSPLFIWALVLTAVLVGFGLPSAVILGFVAIMLVFIIKPLRAQLVSTGVMKALKALQFIPKISQTERTALEAGVTWIEKDLFSGRPDFDKIMKEPYPELTAEEKAFMDGPVEELCRLIQPWKIWKNKIVPPEVWNFIKQKGFLGMIIPKEHGGLGFSALAHSQVIMKLSARSIPTTISVMVPNSLGPAELLIHYGTEAQKKYWLPKLASGEVLPCFGLTEPLAGSDAGSISSSGEVFKGDDGRLMIKLNWNKRWITLAAVSDVIGLAFRLNDPKNLLGKGPDVGITCALIPSTTPGVVIGRRHDPLTIPFHNCPTQGKDVVVALEDVVVGGAKGCGEGWHMLMDCLAAGRGISLPAQATGGAKLASRVVGAHGVVRKQFGFSIGQMEGVEEPMSRIGAETYALEAMRKFTCGALDQGIKPPVVTAMLKYQATEKGRRVINDAMDVMGGAGISLGYRNLLAETYVATPIGITVEGANIMTRTLIVFGQGALRCHPFAYQEVKTLEENDVKGFDAAFWGHIGHVATNLCRSILLSLTRGYFTTSYSTTPELKRYYKRLKWASATFAILSDVAMGTLGGQLKTKQKITGRFADIFSQLYIATCVLRKYEADGRKSEDLAFVHYNLKYALSEIQKSFDGIFDNLKIPGLRWFFKGWLGAWSRINSIGSLASDGWSHAIAHSLLQDNEFRNRLTEGIHIPQSRDEQLGRLEYAMKVVLKTDAAEMKIRKAIKSGTIPKAKGPVAWESALSKGAITQDEFNLLKEAESVRYDAILVDDFSETEYQEKLS